MLAEGNIGTLTQIIINAVEENGFKIASYRTKGNAHRWFNCGDFTIDLCLFSLSDLPHIWFESTPQNMSKYDELVKQLKLIGFDVDTISYTYGKEE